MLSKSIQAVLVALVLGLSFVSSFDGFSLFPTDINPVDQPILQDDWGTGHG